MSKEIAKKEKKDEALDKQIRAHIGAVVGKSFNQERFVKMVAIALMENPSLAKATRVSLLKESVKIARMGLVADGREAALVPFYNKKLGAHEAVGMTMISGMVKLARQSGEIQELAAFLVYENEKFEMRTDRDGQNFIHEPVPFGKKGKVVGAYAFARIKNGGTEIETMDLEQLEAVEGASRAKYDSPWKGPFRGEMMRKTVLRRLLKRLPSNPDLETVLRDENKAFDFTTTAKEVEESPRVTHAEKLREAVLQEKGEKFVETKVSGEANAAEMPLEGEVVQNEAPAEGAKKVVESAKTRRKPEKNSGNPPTDTEPPPITDDEMPI